MMQQILITQVEISVDILKFVSNFDQTIDQSFPREPEL